MQIVRPKLLFLLRLAQTLVLCRGLRIRNNVE